MKENSRGENGMEKMRLLWNLKRTTRQFGLPELVFCCTLFFLGGFVGSFLLFSTSPHVQNEVVKDSVQFLPHGTTGEALPSSVEYQILSWKPRAVYFPNFATSEQCRQIIKMAKVKLRPSGLALRKGETAASTKGVRTSSGTFINAPEDPSGTLKGIDEKIARVTMIPTQNGEAYNVLRYEIGQKYSSHFDSFNPSEYGAMKSQRVASFLLYLSDVEEGGETMFPYENESNMNIGYDYEQCIGLKVKPRQGDGLLFYSLFVNGTIDPTSLHGSCPVIKGEKWVATKCLIKVMMKWWDCLRLSITRVLIRVGFRQRRRNGLKRLKRDVNECEYKDVHVMWEILYSRSRRVRPTRQRHRRALRLLIKWVSCGVPYRFCRRIFKRKINI